MYNKIVVAVDGSEHSKEALKHARALAEAFQSELTVLTVVVDMRNLYFLDAAYAIEYNHTQENYLQYGQRILNGMLKDFSTFKAPLHREIRFGDPATEIIRYVEENPCDLLIMGSKGLTGLSKIMLGSVSDKVMHHVKTPVFIVKMPR